MNHFSFIRLFLLMAVFYTCCTNAQRKSNEKTETVQITKFQNSFFNSINCSAIGGVTVHNTNTADSNKIVIEIDKKYQDAITADIKDSVLYLSCKYVSDYEWFKNGKFFGNSNYPKKVQVDIYVNNLKEITAKSCGDLKYMDSLNLHSKNFNINAEGLANIFLNCRANDSINIIAKNSGRLNVEASAHKVILNCTGLSDVFLNGRADGSINVIAKNSGRLNVEALSPANKAILNCTGLSDIFFKGSVDSINVTAQSSGRLNMEGSAQKAILNCKGLAAVNLLKFQATELQTAFEHTGDIKLNNNSSKK